MLQLRRLLIASLAALPFQLIAAEPVVLGHRLQIQSESLGELRTVQVYRPADYELRSARYPVLYLTDGDEHFRLVASMVDFLAAAGEIPPMLVVGIPNTDRFHDLLAYTRSPGPSPLLNFITREVARKIDAEYRTLPHRLLLGWSDGGLFVLHAMLNAPSQFRSYLAIATATGDDPNLSRTLTEFFSANSAAILDATLFMAADDVTGTSLSRAYETAALLQQRVSRVRDLRFTFRHLEDESHMASPLRGTEEGLRTIFDGWRLVDAPALYESGGLASIERHYTSLGDRLGFPVRVPADVLYTVMNRLESLRRIPEAKQAVARAVELYPSDATAKYYQARLLSRSGDRAEAVSIIKEILQTTPDHGAARALATQLELDLAALAPPVQISDKDLSRLTGRYGDQGRSILVIEQTGNRLVGKSEERSYELTAITPTRFRFRENNVYARGGTLVFLFDSRGRVIGLQIEEGPSLRRLR